MQHNLVVAAIGVGAVAVLLSLVGLATPGWFVSDSELHGGLYVVCGGRGCASYAAEGSMAASKGLVTFAFLCALVAIIDLLVYYFKYVRSEQPHRVLATVVAVFFILAAFFGLIGVIVFGASGKNTAEILLGIHFKLGYSFGLSLVGNLFCGVAGGLALRHRLGLQS